MDAKEIKGQYDALYAEYQDHMHRRAWRIAWGFFFVLVGLLPLMYLFVWLIGPKAWEDTFLHVPKLMFVGAALNVSFVLFLIFRLYRKNLELDAQKRDYLRRLKALRALLPPELTTDPETKPQPVNPRWDDSQDEFKD